MKSRRKLDVSQQALSLRGGSLRRSHVIVKEILEHSTVVEYGVRRIIINVEKRGEVG